MRRICTVLFFLLLASLLSAQQTDTNAQAELQKERPAQNEKIVLPDVNLTITDESEVPLQNQSDNILKDTAPNYGKIDMEELARTKASDKLRVEMQEERKKDNFSLSTFRFYYGLYDNLLAEVNTGKQAGPVNYLFTYLRNKRGAIGMGTNVLYNTEMEIDDLNADLIFTAATNTEINLNLGYYIRNLGLYTNDKNLTESKQNVPLKFGVNWTLGQNASLKAETGADYLNLSHKIPGSYTSDNVLDGYALLNFQANYSRDNFLNASAKYDISRNETNLYHSGRLSVSDKFPVIFDGLNILAGADFCPYSSKPLFWFPTLEAFYKYSSLISFKAGITGEQVPVNIERLMNENQIQNTLCPPDERWIYLGGITFSPTRTATLRGNISYSAYQNLVNYKLDNVSGLYTLYAVTNMGLIEAEGIFEYMPLESLSLNASYKYRLPTDDSLLFFPRHIGLFGIDYKQADWGFEAASTLTLKSEQKTGTGDIPNGLNWDISISKTLSKDIFAELKLNNLLNQEIFERPSVPGGGFTAAFGVRILL